VQVAGEMTPQQLLQVKSQVMSYKHLSKNAPVPPGLQAASEGFNPKIPQADASAAPSASADGKPHHHFFSISLPTQDLPLKPLKTRKKKKKKAAEKKEAQDQKAGETPKKDEAVAQHGFTTASPRPIQGRRAIIPRFFFFFSFLFIFFLV